MSVVGLDFETYGAESLPKHGLARYVGDKSFQPLIGSVSADGYKQRFDLTYERSRQSRELRELIGPSQIVAHNAPFEQAVLAHLGLDYPSSRFIDSAVVARAAGASGHLAGAAPQLLDHDKLADGQRLIKLFSIPGAYQEASGSRLFDPQVIADHPAEWDLFGEYCDLDAELGRLIVRDYLHTLTGRELKYMAITMDMNATGWCVDVPLVEEMQRRYLENQEQALYDFRQDCDAADLNLNSLKQLKEWCAARGVKASSFDEKHVDTLLARLTKKIESGTVTDQAKLNGYLDVEALLKTKQILGGSSLKKLQVILDTAIEDTWNPGRYRLKDQYLHCGAGQTLRTTGRSAQMQNLKRLKVVADMDELLDPGSEWNNTRLAENLRQVFTATDVNGRLIVGDFSGVENRGLAWEAGEDWKVAAFRQGQDLYKVLASKIYGVDYDGVTKEQRQIGKVGELSCGYGAGAGAVQAFASNMGTHLEEAEAATLVRDWRAANPKIVIFWEQLDTMLHNIVEERSSVENLHLPDGFVLTMAHITTPVSLLKLHPSAVSVKLEVRDRNGAPFLKRYFHGCYVRGRNICYYKPTERKTGDVWKNNFVDPKTKQVRFYELYGGKLAGILTQSFCRELFMQSLANVHRWCETTNGQVRLVGQFHDEIVLDWKPGTRGLEHCKTTLTTLMSDPGKVASFPLAAEIKDDYRYTK